ncbi:MAG: hypothetical protein BWY80_00259 [Firmicutes bacterium ADurb.Bin456]|nr:MAG: hypothetical protein BWY80_00259 [Firmicutes bacterium ADurb.Bin456]
MYKPRFEADFNDILERFVRCYHHLNLYVYDNKQKFYIREIDFFARQGESLGCLTFFQDKGMDPRYQRETPMDLAWYTRGQNTGSYQIVLRVETGKLFLRSYDDLAKKILTFGKSGDMPPYLIAIVHTDQENTAHEFVKLLNRNYKMPAKSLILFKIYNFDKKYFHKMICWELPLKKTTPSRTVLTDTGINGLISLHFKDQSGYYKLNGEPSLNEQYG